MSRVTPFRLSRRPRFDDRFGGLAIFINDTESTQIYTTDFSAGGGKWTAEFKFVIRDHFGLDVGDVLKFQRRPTQQDFITGLQRRMPNSMDFRRGGSCNTREAMRLSKRSSSLRKG